MGQRIPEEFSPASGAFQLVPGAAEKRLELGHGEGDTVIGSDRFHCLLTLVERKFASSIVKKLTSRTTAEVNRAMREVVKERGNDCKTITFDNGTEFLDYKALERDYPVTGYFATPYHSWERGSNENLNGLILQYIPKGEHMGWVDQANFNV